MGATILIFTLVIVQSVLNTHGHQSKRFFRKDYTYLDTTESFYKIHTLQKTWHEAKKQCELEGATLFYPENHREATEVLAYWNRIQPQFSWVYIGISDLLVKGIFQTIDGRPIEHVYKNWAPGEPNDVGGVEDCVVLLKDASLNDERCDQTYPFICKKALKDLHWNKECDMPRTDYVYNADIGSCYKFHTDPKNWTEAFKVCSAEMSYLAVINSQSEADYLAHLSARCKIDNVHGVTKRGEALVGFHNRFGDGWQTIKGVKLEDSGYSCWGYKNPDGGNHEKCGSMFFDQKDHSQNGRLNDVGCEHRAFYICEHDIHSHSGHIDDRFNSLLQY